ncbi:MAG: hypothetical protein HYY38_00510, partial [Rhodospirillales bacterium]|nr:hypothetical protein [Rhodospirillales bacterium]
NLLFAFYDGASGASSSVALLKFTGDATTTGITASELQVVAVADNVAANSLIDTNFNVATLPG